MFCCYVWPNPNHSELLIGSICNLSPNRHCFLYYFLICHYKYQYLSLLKGQELEISFSLFSVYFGVGVMTLWGSFSYLIEEGSGPPHPAICAEQGGFYLLQLSQNEPCTMGVHWGLWAHEDTANVLLQAVVTSLLTKNGLFSRNERLPSLTTIYDTFSALAEHLYLYILKSEIHVIYFNEVTPCPRSQRGIGWLSS